MLNISRDEFNNLKAGFSKWRSDRNLSQQEQLSGIILNLLEEVTEYIRGDSIDDKIDALCDICVFCFNAGDFEYDKKKLPTQGSTTIGNILYLINSIPIEVYSGGYAHELHIRPMAKTEEQMQAIAGILYSIVSVALSKIEVLGYNPYKALNEVLKEISSRTGTYDKKMDKFIKDVGAYTLTQAKQKAQEMARCNNFKSFGDLTYRWVFTDWFNNKYSVVKWYKADFSKCKI